MKRLLRLSLVFAFLGQITVALNASDVQAMMAKALNPIIDQYPPIYLDETSNMGGFSIEIANPHVPSGFFSNPRELFFAEAYKEGRKVKFMGFSQEGSLLVVKFNGKIVLQTSLREVSLESGKSAEHPSFVLTIKEKDDYLIKHEIYTAVFEGLV